MKTAPLTRINMNLYQICKRSSLDGFLDDASTRLPRRFVLICSSCKSDKICASVLFAFVLNAARTARQQQWCCFLKTFIFLEYFNPINTSLILLKINNVWDYLTNTSAKNITLDSISKWWLFVSFNANQIAADCLTAISNHYNNSKGGQDDALRNTWTLLTCTMNQWSWVSFWGNDQVGTVQDRLSIFGRSLGISLCPQTLRTSKSLLAIPSSKTTPHSIVHRTCKT